MSESDGVTITYDRQLKPEAVEAFKAMGPAIVEGVSGTPGFRSIRIVQHRDDPTRFLFIERWDSEEAYQGYLDWRASRGEMGGLQAVTVSAETNFWPHLIVEG